MCLFYLLYIFKQNVVDNNHFVASADLCINHMSGTFLVPILQALKENQVIIDYLLKEKSEMCHCTAVAHGNPNFLFCLFVLRYSFCHFSWVEAVSWQ